MEGEGKEKDTERVGEIEEKRAEQATAKPSSLKDPNHYISCLIRLQKLISQWVISIKRGFARQVVKYLRGNLSPLERWRAASKRQGKRRGVRIECSVNGWTWPR